MNSSIDQEKELKDRKSDQSVMLYEMMNELRKITDIVCAAISNFLGDYRKYFGKIFIYEGTVSIIRWNKELI